MATAKDSQFRLIEALATECALTARYLGAPRDQIENFFRRQYIPQPKQLQFHAACRLADLPYGPDQIGFGGARGPGKALALDTPIPTPSGWAMMGDLKVGDAIFAPDGSVTTVTGCSPVQFDRPCFEVLFSDGARIVADADHLWVTFNKNERTQLKRRTEEFRAARRTKRPSRGTGAKPWLAERNRFQRPATSPPPTGTVRTTQEIAESLYHKKEINHSIKTTEPLLCAESSLPLDPYILGLWLGDGDTIRGYLTTADSEIIEEVKRAGWTIERAGSGRYRYKAAGLTAALARAGVLNNKHIPSAYLRASFNQRQALLQGLMDTDGCVDKDGACEFTSTNYALAAGVFELVLTLGVKPTMAEGRATLNGRHIGPKWRIRFTSALPCFRLPRKIERQKRDSFNGTHRMRYIVAVNPVLRQNLIPTLYASH
jgi:replicative DNA helicase